MKKIFYLSFIALAMFSCGQKTSDNAADQAQADSLAQADSIARADSLAQADSIAKADSVAKADSIAKAKAKAANEVDDAEAIAFVTDMFNRQKFESNSFLNANCTSKMLSKLRAQNEYDDGGYATWLFRSEAQDGPSNVTKIISVTPQGNGWYKYSFYDMGVKGTNKIKLVKKGGSLKIDDVKRC